MASFDDPINVFIQSRINTQDLDGLFHGVRKLLTKRSDCGYIDIVPSTSQIMTRINAKSEIKLYLDTIPIPFEGFHDDVPDYTEDSFFYDQNNLTYEEAPPLNSDYVTEQMNDIRLHFWINSKIADNKNPAEVLKEVNDILSKKTPTPKYWANELAYVQLLSGKCDAYSFSDTPWTPAVEESKNAFRGFLKSTASDEVNVFNPGLYIDFEKYITGYTTGNFCIRKRKRNDDDKSGGNRTRTHKKTKKTKRTKTNKNTKKTK